jgi:hypothetical protein
LKVGHPSVIRVQYAVLRIYRCLDLGRVSSAELSSIERNTSSKIRAHPHPWLIDDSAAKAETEGTAFACAVRARFQPICRCEEVFSDLGTVELAEK